MQIQKLRLKQGWSQQQLAEASGLSTRTIQRIEAGQIASTETLKSIAAVFGVEFSTLQPETDMTTTSTARPATANDKLEEEAFEHVRKLRRFYLHLFRYLIVALALLAFNLISPQAHTWIYWVIGGWGLGILLHASRVFGSVRLLGPQWERREVEKRLGRPL